MNDGDLANMTGVEGSHEGQQVEGRCILVLQPHFKTAFVGRVVAASGAGLVFAPPV